jgi:hypothetical protein
MIQGMSDTVRFQLFIHWNQIISFPAAEAVSEILCHPNVQSDFFSQGQPDIKGYDVIKHVVTS